MKSSASQQGVTLITLSVLLLVASAVIIPMLPSLQSKLTGDSATTTRLNALLVSLRGYQAANGTLPCPADASQPIGSTSYGVAAANSGASGNCTGGSPAANYVDTTNHVAVGMLPVHTLGLPYSLALDGYGRDITYAVDTNATACWTSSSLTGQITVTDNGAANTTIAALVSHGLDGHGAWIPLTASTGTAVRLNAGSTDTDQLTNAHVDTSFNRTTTLTNFVRKIPTSTFDDLIVYKNPNWTLNNLPKSIPTITAITPPANGTYTTGQVLTFTVTYSSAVTVTTTGGTPYLSLSAITGSIGTSNLAQATYQSGSGTTSLTFSYTVVAADSAPTGLTMTSSITLNGGSIGSGSACAMTGFTAPSLSQVIVGQYIYVADAGNNRVQEFNSSGSYITKFGSGGSGNGQLSYLEGMAIDSTGNIWAADTFNNRAEKFNSSGTFLMGIGSGYNGVSGSIGSSGSGNGQFNELLGIAIDATGNVWIADYNNKRVQEFNSSGTYITKFGSSGSGNGQFNDPGGIAIDVGGNVWVADIQNNRLEKFNSSGTFLMGIGSGYNGVSGSIGSSGTGNGQFTNPEYITIDSGGNLWVADTYNNRVQEFNGSGTFLMGIGSGYNGVSGSIGSSGTGNGQFQYSVGITIDSGGNIWVADDNGNRVQKFNSSGSYLSQLGGCASGGCTNGSGNGQLYQPRAVVIGAR